MRLLAFVTTNRTFILSSFISSLVDKIDDILSVLVLLLFILGNEIEGSFVIRSQVCSLKLVSYSPLRGGGLHRLLVDVPALSPPRGWKFGLVCIEKEWALVDSPEIDEDDIDVPLDNGMDSKD